MSLATGFEDWAAARKAAAQERDRRALDRWADDGGCHRDDQQARKGA